LEAYDFARKDVYRASTHNKGIMNGIDSVCLATGQDWRAVEASSHTFASRNNKYMPLTHY
jgi:hydroxymethylglutaryl-CoA reductase